MKRDIDLCRKILKEIESIEDPWGPGENPRIQDYDTGKISYHVKLLSEAGLIEAQDVSSMGADGFEYLAGNLTWDGHEFLDASNDDTIWDTAKEHVLKPGVSFTFGLLLEWLKMKGKEKLGLP